MTIKTKAETKIMSEVKAEDQFKLLELIGSSLKKAKPVQYKFIEALAAFTSLSPEDKGKEISVWINTLENILNRK